MVVPGVFPWSPWSTRQGSGIRASNLLLHGHVVAVGGFRTEDLFGGANSFHLPRALPARSSRPSGTGTSLSPGHTICSRQVFHVPTKTTRVPTIRPCTPGPTASHNPRPAGTEPGAAPGKRCAGQRRHTSRETDRLASGGSRRTQFISESELQPIWDLCRKLSKPSSLETAMMHVPPASSPLWMIQTRTRKR